MNGIYKVLLFSLICACAVTYAQDQVIPQAGDEVGQVVQDTGIEPATVDNQPSDVQGRDQSWNEHRPSRPFPQEIDPGYNQGYDFSKQQRIQKYCRAYAQSGESSQNCRSIANDVYAGLDEPTRGYIDRMLDQRCRIQLSDLCLLKRLELLALIKSARSIRGCGEQVAGYNPDQIVKPLFSRRVSCTAVREDGVRRLNFYTLDYGQVMNIVQFSRPMYQDPKVPPNILPPRFDNVRPLDNQPNGIDVQPQDAGTSN